MIKNHFTATGIVFNSRNEVLMIKHKQLMMWLPPGGHVDENELPNDAVLREIFEETGIRCKIIENPLNLSNPDEGCIELPNPLTILLEDIDGDGKHNHIDIIYICSADNEDFLPNKEEIDGIGWFSYEDIMDLETPKNVILTIERAIQATC